MAALWERFKILVPLLAAVYLGFYVFGVVRSVSTPFQLVGLSVIAVACVLWLIAYGVAIRRGISPIAGGPVSKPA